MATIKDLEKSVKYGDRWLSARQAKHYQMMEASIVKLQKRILSIVDVLATSESGRVEGLKANLKQAQKIHRRIEELFYSEFNASAKKVIDDFKSVSDMIEKSFSYLGESVKFTSIDKTTMEVLRDGYYSQYLALADNKKALVVQAVYDQVISGGTMSQLKRTISAQLVGDIDKRGRPLTQYAKIYANDMIMNYHSEVNIIKAQSLGIKHYLYVGNLIEDSRDFCMTRAGKYYTENQINSWTFKWQGKSGPAMTNRGGYNCRHHWQPIRPEWLEGRKSIDVANWHANN